MSHPDPVLPYRDVEVVSPNAAVEQISDDAATALRNLEQSPFSTRAFATLTSKINEYIADLVNESIKIAHRHRADTVSAAHVESASEHLVASASHRIFRHLGTVGGILLGAAISNVLGMVTAGKFTSAGTIISLISAVVGAFLVALHIARE